MPWFGSGSTLRIGSSKAGTYWVGGGGEDGRRGAKSSRKRGGGNRHHHNDVAAQQAAPAGILKRSGRPRAPAYEFEYGMVPQEMAARVPMPSEQNVNAMFSEMVVSIIRMQLRAYGCAFV